MTMCSIAPLFDTINKIGIYIYEWYRLTLLFDPNYLLALYIIPIPFDILFFT